MQKSTKDYATNADLSSAGKLSAVPSRVLVDHLHKERFSGRLILSFREKRKKIWFYEGEIFRIQSNLVPELLGQMMIEKNWLNEVDLRACLEIQRQANGSRLIGEVIQELYRVPPKEIDKLHNEQKIRGLIQALTWDEGDYELTEMSLKSAETSIIAYDSFIESIKALLETTQKNLGGLFKLVSPWKPKSGTVNMAEFPIWSILAGCRVNSVSGILTIRKQNKLHEIVVKHGVPLTLYEGTFGQPRQTIVVRQASEEHERFFIDSVFKLFSFVTGSAHFRTLGDLAEDSKAPSSNKEILDHTKVLGNSQTDKAVFTMRFFDSKKESFLKYFAGFSGISKRAFRSFMNLFSRQ